MYSNDLICNILKYIDNHLLEKINVDMLCKEFHYNRFYIMKLFKREIGVSIIYYINALKIYNSVMEIINNNNTCFMKVALNNGFISLEYFSETFKNIMKVSPRIFKKSLNRYNNLPMNTILLIHENLILLKQLINKKVNYIQKQKPSCLPVKKISIFN